MSSSFNAQPNSKPKTWVVWFILGIGLTVALENPIFLILGTSLSVTHKHFFQVKEE